MNMERFFFLRLFLATRGSWSVLGATRIIEAKDVK
jgi:hypothetical protein